MKIELKIERNKCIGCGRCLTACSMGREISALKNGSALSHGLQKAPLPPLLWIEQSAGISDDYRVDICRHCDKPPCADACVAGAIYVDFGSGTVQIATERCVGCWSCVMECPFAAVRVVKGGKAAKCNRCLTLGLPQCVRFCPTQALQLVKHGTRQRERADIIGRVSLSRQRG